MDLLLDETICAGTVAVPREMVRLAGGVNKRLGRVRTGDFDCVRRGGVTGEYRSGLADGLLRSGKVQRTAAGSRLF